MSVRVGEKRAHILLCGLHSHCGGSDLQPLTLQVSFLNLGPCVRFSRLVFINTEEMIAYGQTPLAGIRCSCNLESISLCNWEYLKLQCRLYISAVIRLIYHQYA